MAQLIDLGGQNCLKFLTSSLRTIPLGTVTFPPRALHAFKISTLIVAVFFSVGCRWQVGRSGNPTPTPTPSPTPSPTPVVSITAAESAADLSVDASAMSVAAASADYFEAASVEAVEKTENAMIALAAAADSPSDALAELSTVKKSIYSARDAYLQAEASVFLVDPESVDELQSLPDPLGVGTPDERGLLMDELAAAIEKMEDLLSSGPLDANRAANLLVEARAVGEKIKELEQELRGLADAWGADGGGNFRNRFFLTSPDSAVARLFQGLLAMTGEVLPATVDSADYGSGEISARLAAVRDIYLGSKDGAAAVHQLVAGASPLQAALTRASIARAVALAGVLEVTPDDVSLRTQLSSALDEVTRQLIFAAGALGIVVVDTAQP